MYNMGTHYKVNFVIRIFLHSVFIHILVDITLKGRMIKQVKQLKYSELLHIVFVSKLLNRIPETFSLGKLFYEDLRCTEYN